ncbi:31107_t:CDS:2, partial [Gigaspora margarita]
LQRRLLPPTYLVLNEWSGFLVSKIIYELTKLEVADIIKAQVYTNTHLSLVLCKDHPNTFRNIILLYEEYSSATQYLAYDLKLQTDNENEQMTSFAKAHDGMGAFECIYGKGLHQDYDWSQYRNATFPDEQAIKILKTIHSAIPSTNASSSYHEVPSNFNPKLLVAEILIDDRTQFPLLYQLDILMMCM